jgi:hypothetical protein
MKGVSIMKISTIALVLGSAVVTCAAGAGVAACSSSSGTGEPTGNYDSGAADTSTGDAGAQDSAPNGDSSSDSSTADAACAPTLHVSSPDGGIYCPFSKDFTVDGGEYAYCTTGTQSCCLSPSSDAGLSTCETTGSCPTGFSQWQCAGPEDCVGTNNVCCLTSGPTESSTTCTGTLKTEGFDNTRCTTAGECTGTVEAGMYTDDQFITCEQQSDCPSGKTCTAVKTTGTPIGLCL